MTVIKLDLHTPETKVCINVASKGVTSFSKENLETFNSMFNPDSSPKIYGQQSFVKYLHNDLIDINDIEDEHNSETVNSQRVRVGLNPQYEAIKTDITLEGFDLSEKPIMVFKLPNGKYEVGEGRTRLAVLKSLGMTNIIANVFDVATTSDRIRFALMMNTIKKPYGAASEQDILQAIRSLISLGSIKSLKPTAENVLIMREAIEAELFIIAGKKLKPAQWNYIVEEGITDLTGVKMVSSFPMGNGVAKWLEKNGYTDNREVMYVPVAEFLEKIYSKMLNLYKNYPNIKEFKLIIYKGTLKASDPEKDWVDNVLKFKQTYDKFESTLSELRFRGAEVDTSRFKLYGAIPQVESLKKKYPMNRLVLY